jgi:GTPase SAR1 family protein
MLEIKESLFLITDTSGQERYQSLTWSYLRDCQIALFCFSILENQDLFNSYSDMLEQQDDPERILLLAELNDIFGEQMIQKGNLARYLLR